MELHAVPDAIEEVPFSKILVPVDFSRASQTSREYAVGLAKALGAEIHLLHAWNPLAWISPDGELMLPEHALKAFRDACGQGLDSWCEEVTERGIPCVAHLEAGAASPTISQIAVEVGAELIVMGASGRSELPHVSLGSTTERTIRLAPCSVIVIPEGVVFHPELRLRKIVVGIEFSEASHRAVEFACDLGGALGRPEVILLHAQPDDQAARPDNGQAETEIQIQDWVVFLTNRGRQVRVQASDNGLAQTLVETAGEEAADLVVVGGAARSTLVAELFGNAAERRVRSVGCATATVR
jgi:nucleotide-binding universal stress UspA family protein